MGGSRASRSAYGTSIKDKSVRGYFGIGAEGISKPMNLGALMRTAHAFGASFTFSVDAAQAIRQMQNADTSK